MRLFMIFFALVVAVASGLAFWLMNSPDGGSVVADVPEVQQVEVPEVSVIVARRDIPVGHRITEEDLDQQTWPQSLALPEFVLAGGQDQLIDRIARTPFKERQPIMTSFVANPNDPGFLAAQLPAGKRAVTIPIDDISGVSGFIFPGDHVDVLIKHQVSLNQDYEGEQVASSTPGAPPTNEAPAIPLPLARSHNIPTLLPPSKLAGQPILNVTEVLIANVRVLAVGTFISLQDQENRGAPSTITVEVSELDAQRIRQAEQGSLTLTLRSLDDVNEPKIPRPVGQSDLTRLTPPSYFPNIYDAMNYDTRTINLEEVPYEEGGSTHSVAPGTVNVIRGVIKDDSAAAVAPVPSTQSASPVVGGES